MGLAGRHEETSAAPHACHRSTSQSLSGGPRLLCESCLENINNKQEVLRGGLGGRRRVELQAEGRVGSDRVVDGADR